jgi:hypothetical protein
MQKENSEDSSSDLSENEYYVEKILDKKIEDGEVRYLVKWENYPDEDSTWEPVENLSNSKHLIEDFDKNLLEKTLLKRKQGRPPKDKETNNKEYSLAKKEKKIEKEFKNLKIEPEVLESFGVNVPIEVLSVKKDKNENIICLCRFEERNDGLPAENAYISSCILKDTFPKILLKFYESKIKFIEKK